MFSSHGIVITGSYPPATCGIGDYTHALVAALAQEGMRVEVWTRHGSPVSTGVRPAVDRWDRAGMRLLMRQIAEVRPNLVHLQYEIGVYDDNPLIALLPLATRRAGAALVTTLHSLDGPPHWGRAHRMALLPLLLGSQDLVVCSQRQYRALRRMPTVRHKVQLIPIGSNIAVAPQPGSGVRSERTPLRLIYFGFVWRGRNLELLIEALARICAAGQNAVLEIVGGVRDEEYLREIMQLAARSGVADRVRCFGDLPAETISRMLHGADIAVLPYSTGVSTGRGTLMAALAHRLPVVTYGTPENRSPLFQHGINMFIAPLGDERCFIGYVQQLGADATLRGRLAQGAATLAAEFDWLKIARQTLVLSAYKSLRAA